jgi:uncharacterized repeat protein (TIGR01451 family)
MNLRSPCRTFRQTPRDPLRAIFALLLALPGALAATAAFAQACGLQADVPPSPGEQFGCSIFVQGDTLAVGANLDRQGPAATGSVTLFARSGSGWARQAKLAPAELRDGAQFGFTVAISGDTLAVGAPFDDTDRARGSGAVYVFRFAGGSWSQEAKLAPAKVSTGDGFGLNLSASGDVLVVGAPFTSQSGSLAGAVYVYQRTSGGWSEEPALSAGDPAPFTEFGYSVAVDGGTLIAGAPFARGPGAGPGAGAAYVFARSRGGWVQQARLTAQGAADGAEVGAAVAVAGGIAVVGARRDGTGGQAGAGAAYSFSFDGSSGSWRQTARLVAPDASGGALFGVSLALSGTDHLLVGARGDSQVASGAGAAYVFSRDPGTGRWLPGPKQIPATATPGAVFGQSVSLSGNDVAIGGPHQDLPGASHTGAVALCQPPSAALTIKLDDGLTQVLPGQTVVYTLTISNLGTQVVTGAMVTDVFPPQLENVRWCPPREGPGCPQPRSGDIHDTLDLPVGPSVYTVTAEVSPDARGTVTDQACVAAPAFGGGAGSLCATDTDTVAGADLALAKSAPATVAMGQVLTYDLHVTNHGPSPATGVILTDPWPPGLRPLLPVDPRCIRDPVQGRFSCALGTLPPGRSVSLRLAFRVPACYQAPTPIVNTASVAANEPDPDLSNNLGTARTALVAAAPSVPARPACPADLSIQFDPDPEINAPPPSGDISVLYTVALQNTGTADVASARVSGAFSPNLKRVLWCQGLGCTPSNPGPLADTASVASGQTVVYQVELFVPPNFNDFLCHTVTARVPGGEVDPTPQDDSANQLLCLTHGPPCPPRPPGFCPGVRQPDLEVAFVRDAEIDPLAGRVLYTVAVQNGGPANAVGAQVSSIFSPNIAPPFSPNIAPVLWCRGLGCTPVNPGPLADVLTVPAGETVVYQVELTVPETFNDLLCYTVSALAPGGALESGPPDNSQSELLCLTHTGSCPPRAPGFCPGAALASHPDLDVEFVGAPEVDAAEGKAIYTVLVQNGGNADAVAAQVSGVFSPDLTPVAWCQDLNLNLNFGLGCTPSNPGPFADTPTLRPGDFVAYEVAVNVPAGFHDNLCFTVTAKVPGDVEPGPPDSTRSELLCLTDGPPCPPPPPGFCQEGGQGHPDLEVAFFGDPMTDPVAPAALYTVSLQNAGDADAVDAQLSSLFSSAFSSAIGPVSWCQGLGCTPVNAGPLAATLTVPAGGFLFFQVKVEFPLGFNDFLCYTVTATVPGDAELIPDNTQNEPLCAGSTAFCSSPPPPTFQCPHID